MFLPPSKSTALLIAASTLCTATITQADTSAPTAANEAPLQQSVKFKFKTFADKQIFDAPSERYATIQSLQADYESAVNIGKASIGIDTSLFAALRLMGSDNAGNLAYIDKSGHGRTDSSWAYPGQYLLKGRYGEAGFKLGLQRSSGAYFEGKENRALPATFRGITLSGPGPAKTNLEAGSFDAVIGRGHSHLAPLSTAFGGVLLKRVSYAGATWNTSGKDGVNVFVEQADDVWNKYYGEWRFSSHGPFGTNLNLFTNAYLTKDQGAGKQGKIDNKALSVALSLAKDDISFTLGYQHIFSDQFYDFISETSGATLANQLLMDYNAPRERSLQMLAEIDGKHLHLPGLKLVTWTVWSQGADASKTALGYAAPDHPLHDTYWKNGQPIHGRHHELGINTIYSFKDSNKVSYRLKLFAAHHWADPFYGDGNVTEYRVTFEVGF